jgi:hypothetical protein
MSAVDAEEIAAEVSACPGVAEMSAGSLGTTATHLPGRRIDGVRVRGGHVEIHLVGKWGVPIPSLVADVRASIADLVDDHEVDVTVEDLTEPPPSQKRSKS